MFSAMPRERLVTLPNAISLSRLGLAAAFVAASDVAVRVGLLAAAAFTDFLDGWIARRRGATRWGALIDPIADRAFALAAVSALLFDGALATWEYFVLISRDLFTALGFLVARAVAWLRDVTFQARWLGKAVTVLQLAAFLVALLAPAWTTPVVAAVGVASAASIADYTLALWRARVRAA